MTKAKFIVFEKVRRSGLTNMYNVDSVRLVSVKYGGMLSVEDCFDIMLNYDKYRRKYLEIKWKNEQ
ncbi:MAG: hypothetical protein WA064_03375 [Candidatus Moraniibacteriota bacterium]